MVGKIEFVAESSVEEVRGILNPLVRDWFFGKFERFSLTQLYGVKKINDRKNILISAPTGGTKTLTAFLSILNYLVELALKKELEDKIYAVYCSPLKALSNDIFVNLISPLEEIKGIAEKRGLEMQEIRVGLRTGDTTVSERAKMAKKPPHIYITTPESLTISLTSPKFSEKFSALEFLIVDEIHAMPNKRGVDLSLTLERLNDISLIEPVRVGLSATISPLEEVAKFLVGVGRDCLIAEVKMVKKIEIDMDFPGDGILESQDLAMQDELFTMIDKIVQKNKTTLIFTNTRAGTERIIHHLETKFPTKYLGNVGAHHSSMSKEMRFRIEERLRKGELKVVVSSTSLELGIDIGNVDFVIMLKSPKGSARALQRIGRAGHKLHDNPKGKFLVLERDELVECGILMKEMIERKIDKINIPKNALDVLAQHIYGMAITQVWDAEKMLSLIRKSYCYSDLTKNDFYSVVSYLAGDYALENRNVYAKIWYDSEEGKIGKKGRLARVIYLTNLGTIPAESFISVVVSSPMEKKGLNVGKIDEGFLEKMKRGDVFVLGGKKYQFLYSRGMKAFVKADVSKRPTIPSWFSEMLPLSFDSGLAVAKFRRLVQERLGNKKECIKFIKDYLYCGEKIAKEIYSYLKEQNSFSIVPNDEQIVVEKFKEEKEVLMFHCTFGRRVNDALARAFAFAAARQRMRDVEIGVDDNGFFISGEKIDENKVLKYVNSENLREILNEAVNKTDVLKRRFRHCAARSLMILRNYKGREKSVGKQQVHSEFLYSSVRKISEDFPILRESKREVMEDVMDVKNAIWVLEQIESGKMKIKKVRVPFVSPFGVAMFLKGRADLIKMEDKVSFLKRMHELHLKAIKK